MIWAICELEVICESHLVVSLQYRTNTLYIESSQGEGKVVACLGQVFYSGSEFYRSFAGSSEMATCIIITSAWILIFKKSLLHWFFCRGLSSKVERSLVLLNYLPGIHLVSLRLLENQEVGRGQGWISCFEMHFEADAEFRHTESSPVRVFIFLHGPGRGKRDWLSDLADWGWWCEVSPCWSQWKHQETEPSATSLTDSFALILNTWCQLSHLIRFEFSCLNCCDGFLCLIEQDLVGTLSVLHAEIETPLNLLCDCMNNPPSQRVSLRCSFAIYCVAFGRFLMLLWQSRLAAAARAPGPESNAAVPCLSPAPTFCSLPPPTPSSEERHIDLSPHLQPAGYYVVFLKQNARQDASWDPCGTALRRRKMLLNFNCYFLMDW